MECKDRNRENSCGDECGRRGSLILIGPYGRKRTEQIRIKEGCAMIKEILQRKNRQMSPGRTHFYWNSSTCCFTAADGSRACRPVPGTAAISSLISDIDISGATRRTAMPIRSRQQLQLRCSAILEYKLDLGIYRRLQAIQQRCASPRRNGIFADLRLWK